MNTAKATNILVIVIISVIILIIVIIIIIRSEGLNDKSYKQQQQSTFQQFDSQFSQSSQQRFPPSQDAGLSSGFSVSSPQGIQSTSALSQSFRPLQSSNQGQSQSPPL